MADRKARLAALAAKAGRSNQPDEGIDEPNVTTPSITFRNYVPQDESLLQNVPEDNKPEPVAKKLKLEDALEKAQEEVRLQSSNASNFVATTKKINWDLKRDIEEQLDKLERRTQKALVALLKERLAKEADMDEVLD
jgi:coiled-coil domain-containing protein 12